MKTQTYITIATLLAAGSAFANADTDAAKTFDSTKSALISLLLDVSKFKEIAGSSFSGSSSAADIFTFNGTWGTDSTDGYLGICNNGSSSTKNTTFYSSWQVGTNSAKNTSLFNATDIFTSSTNWDNISNIAIAYSFLSATGSTSTTVTAALVIDYVSGAPTVYTIQTSNISFSSYSGGLSATSLTVSDYVSSYSLDLTSTFASADAAKVAALALIPEPSAFGLLAGLGALALAGTRRRRRK